MTRTLLTSLATAALLPALPTLASNPWINEFHYDNSSGDVGEFIEIFVPDLYLGGIADVGLTLYNGSNGEPYGSIPSPSAGDTIAGVGTFYSYAFPSNGIQNGAPDGFALHNASGASVFEFLSYEGSFTAVGGFANGLTSTDVGVSQPGNTGPGLSLQRTGTGSSGSDFTWAPESSQTLGISGNGALNTGQTITAGSPPPPPPPPPASTSVALSSLGGSGITFDATLADSNDGPFTGAGFSPNPTAGQLDSDSWSVTGLSDGPINPGDTAVSGDAARGASSGGVISGGIYAFDVGGGNTALGFQPSGSDLAPGTIALTTVNDTGGTIAGISVSYDALVFNDQPRANSLGLAYSPGGTSQTFDVINRDAGVPPPSNFQANIESPEAADGSPAWVSTPQGQTIYFGTGAGEEFQLLWSTDDVSGSGSRDEFAIDNIVVAPVALASSPIPTTSPDPNYLNVAIAGSLLTGGANLNQTGYTNPFDPLGGGTPFASAGDAFGVFQRGVSPTIPFDVVDDSAGSFSPDTQGIIMTGDTDPFFAIVDLNNGDNSAPATAELTYDISSSLFGVTGVAIDIGAMGDFEGTGSDIEDSLLVEYSIDGGTFTPLFTSEVQEDATLLYAMESGTLVSLSDPMFLNGVLLDNSLKTIYAPIAGLPVGNSLTLRLTAFSDGGGEAIAFRNLQIFALIPEPSRALLLLLGIAPLLLRRRRA